MNKKGLSAIVGVMLLIVMGLGLASIIFVWGKGFVSRLSPPIDCTEVSFEAEITNENGEYFLNIVNTGDIPIGGAVVKSINEGDVQIIEDFDISISPGQGERTGLDIENGEDKYRIVPKIFVNDSSGMGEIVACSDDESYESRYQEVRVNNLN